MKKCIDCGIEKTKENTGKDSHLKDGFSSCCKVCKNKRGKESYYRHRDEINKRRSEKRHVDITLSREYGKQWRAKNKDKIRETGRSRRLKDPEKVRAEGAKSQKKCRKKRNEYKRKWYEKNKDRIKSAMPTNQKISKIVASNIRSCLYGKKGGNHWEDLVGFTLYHLMEHLEKQFEEGMSWGNYGRHGWHIDHKRPISSFKFSSFDDEEFKQCWSLDNLQPLWAKDNLKKGNKYE